MTANVTTVIHYFREPRSQFLLKQVAERLGLVVVDARSLEDVNWLSTKLERFLIVVSDNVCNLADLNIEAPVVFLDTGMVAKLEALGKNSAFSSDGLR